jgi:hypothetical protein
MDSEDGIKIGLGKEECSVVESLEGCRESEDDGWVSMAERMGERSQY